MTSSFAMQRLLDRRQRGCKAVENSAGPKSRQGLIPPPHHTTTVSMRNCLAASSSAIFEEEGDVGKKTKFLDPYARPPSPGMASDSARATATDTPSTAATDVWVWGGRSPNTVTPRHLGKNVRGAAAGRRKDTALTVKIDGGNGPLSGD